MEKQNNIDIRIRPKCKKTPNQNKKLQGITVILVRTIISHVMDGIINWVMDSNKD